MLGEDVLDCGVFLYELDGILVLEMSFHVK